jgi:hypothetical protein
MKTYYICTDAEAAFVVGESLNEAIRWFFGRDKPHITDKRTLRREMELFSGDGAFCWIECDGERVFQVGDCF